MRAPFIALLALCALAAARGNIPVVEDALDAASSSGGFHVGVGIYDVTGPATEVDFMGYAFPTQIGHGIHFRLRARAFVFQDANGNRAVYLSADLCMAMLGMKQLLVESLQAIYGPTLYTHDNVMISGIHTHSGPGAYSWFLLYDISMLGLDTKHLSAVVAGMTQAIVNAHNNLEAKLAGPAGSIYWNWGELWGANINRSPTSYLANPAEERAMYDADVDKNMTVIRIEDGDGTEAGAVAWFAVHCTSMHNTNKLISGDNKGYASYLFEQEKNGDVLPGQGPFVAAFGQSNEGDVSPNTMGAWCGGVVGSVNCSGDRSLCDGRNEQCYGVGPAGFSDDFGSTSIIANKEYDMASQLYESATEELVGDVQFLHSWIDMTDYVVTPEFSGQSQNVTTCRPAVGFSFAAGTTDGPGAFNFYQGDNCTNCNPFWQVIRDFLKKPTPEQIACQSPKPILLDVGEIQPYPWVPTTVPVQLFRVGQLVIAAVPGEFTTMSGRRLRNTIREAFAAENQTVTVVISGLSNCYTQYIATYEEYQWQRYEAASTLFGPFTLAAYQQIFAGMATAMARGESYPAGTPPTNVSYVNFDLEPKPILDMHPIGKPYGTVETDVNSSYQPGDSVNVTFWGANLRNNYMTNSTYLTVELQSGADWVVVANDGNWETRLVWARPKGTAYSLVTVEWAIPPTVTAGTYRIQTFGYALTDPFTHATEPYSGTSSTFTVSS